MANTSAIDAAVIAVLANDSSLTSLAPGGVFRDVAPQGVSVPFVIVSQMAHEDRYGVGSSRAAFEIVTYLAKVVDQSNSGTNAQTAANRVNTLLHGATLSATGYHAMLCERTERVAYVEVDDQSDRRWQHRGGMYEVTAEATS